MFRLDIIQDVQQCMPSASCKYTRYERARKICVAAVRIEIDGGVHRLASEMCIHMYAAPMSNQMHMYLLYKQLRESACLHVHVTSRTATNLAWLCRFYCDQQTQDLSLPIASKAMSLASLGLLCGIPVNVEGHKCFPLHDDDVRHLLHIHVPFGLLLPVPW